MSRWQTWHWTDRMPETGGWWVSIIANNRVLRWAQEYYITNKTQSVYFPEVVALQPTRQRFNWSLTALLRQIRYQLNPGQWAMPHSGRDADSKPEPRRYDPEFTGSGRRKMGHYGSILIKQSGTESGQSGLRYRPQCYTRGLLDGGSRVLYNTAKLVCNRSCDNQAN